MKNLNLSEKDAAEFQALGKRLFAGEMLTPNESQRFAALSNANSRNDERVKALSAARKGTVQDALDSIEGITSEAFEMLLDSLKTLSKDAFRSALTVISTGDAAESIRVGNAYLVFPDDKDSPSVEIVIRRKALAGTADSVKTHAKRDANGEVSTDGPVPNGDATGDETVQ